MLFIVIVLMKRLPTAGECFQQGSILNGRAADLTLEMHCIEQNHYCTGRQLGQDDGNLPLGCIFHPIVDGCKVCLVLTRQGLWFCVIEPLRVF